MIVRHTHYVNGVIQILLKREKSCIDLQKKNNKTWTKKDPRS